MSILQKLFFFFSFACLWSCTDIVDVSLDETEPIFVIDAWIDNQSAQQKIIVTQTQDFYDAEIRQGLQAQSVTVTNVSQSRSFDFTRNPSDGAYYWDPVNGDSLGARGDDFELNVVIDDIRFSSVTSLDSVPEIDTVMFLFDDNYRPQGQPIEDAFYVDFVAIDLPLLGNKYWIKAFKNGVFFNNPLEINVASDAGFSEGFPVNGSNFILPLREGVNRIEEGENGEIQSPYEVGDDITIEIHSISELAFNLFIEYQAATENDNPFSQLFAAPFSNFDTNISGVDNNGGSVDALGFFNVAEVSSYSETLTSQRAALARENFDKGL